MCSRILILHKKTYRSSYQLLKPLLEKNKVQLMALQLTETRITYQYLRPTRIAQCIPLVIHVLWLD